MSEPFTDELDIESDAERIAREDDDERWLAGRPREGTPEYQQYWTNLHWNDPETRARYMAKAAEIDANAPLYVAPAGDLDPYRLYSIADLDDLPPQEWLVAERIPANGIVGLIGGKGTKKTFTALDLALHVATGSPWHGRECKQGGVVYIYAEGPFGAKSRVRAWCHHHTATTGQVIDPATLPIRFLPRRVPMNDGRIVMALVHKIQQLPWKPALTVVDTLNQNLDGEEDGKGMGGFTAGCMRIRETFNATVLVAHHTPQADAERGRGHGAFDGALDTRLIVSCDADRVTIECNHQRNGPDGWTIAFEAFPMQGSLILRPSSLDGGPLQGQRRAILAKLAELGSSKYSTWLKQSEIQTSSFKKARTWLAAKTYITQTKGSYSVTDAGLQALRTPGTPEGHHA